MNAEEIDNSNFKEPDLWGSSTHDERGDSYFHNKDVFTLLVGIVCMLVSRCSIVLLFFCAFSRLTIQQIFIAIYHISSYFLGAVETAKKRHSE